MDIEKLEEKVDLIFRKAKKSQTLESLFEKYDITNENEKTAIKAIVDKKINEYQIIETTPDKYISINKTSFRVGRFSKKQNGGICYVDHFYTDKEDNEKDDDLSL